MALSRQRADKLLLKFCEEHDPPEGEALPLASELDCSLSAIGLCSLPSALSFARGGSDVITYA